MFRGMRRSFSKITLVIFLLALILGAGFWFFKSYQEPTSTPKLVFPRLEEIEDKLKIEKLLQKELPEIKETEKEISTPSPLTLSETEKGVDVLEREKIIYWTNLGRKEKKLEGLKENETLNKAAKQKLEDMFEKQYFEHISPDGVGAGDIAESIGYQYLRVGENLALGNFKSEKELINGWMASLGHRENILNPKFKEIGVATRKDLFKGKKTFLAVQIFAAPLSGCSAPDENLSLTIGKKKADLEKFQNSAETLENEIETLQAKNEKLYQDALSLIEEGKNLIEQGNELIKKGNKASNQEKAKNYWKQGEILQDEGQEKIDSAIVLQEKIEVNNVLIETKIEEYNNLIFKINSLFEELQDLISTYNSQVSRFNNCIE